MTTSTTPLAGRATDDSDYRRLGLSQDSIAPWEDGARTDGGRGSFEWWYFDAHLDDGAALVVMFMNKDVTESQKPLDPLVRINLDLPDGRSLQKTQHYAPKLYSAGTDHADVHISGNRFVGDLHRYRITAAIDEVSVEVTLTGQVPPWRPALVMSTSAPIGPVSSPGYLLFHRAGSKSAISSATRSTRPPASATTITTGATLPHQAHPRLVLGHVAGRSVLGDHCLRDGHEKFGYAPIVSFMLAKDGRVVAGDASKVAFTREDVSTDENTGKPVANILRYSYEDGDDRYVVTYTRQEDLATNRMIDGVHGFKRFAATLVRFDGAYLRFSGECRVQYFHAGALVEEFADKAIWELMYFGHPR